MKTFLLAAASSFALMGAAQAATIVGAVSVDASSERANVPAGNLIDQSGLSASYTSGVTDFDSFVASTTHSLIAVGNEWFSGTGNTTATLTFDLGLSQTIDRVALWLEDASSFGTGILSASTDGINFSFLDTIMPAAGVRNQDYGATVFGFAATDLQYFRIEMSNCPNPNATQPTQECSLGEIAFSAVDMAPIPLPAGGLLLATGLAGLAWRRKRA